jgi:cyclopropane fatty-acyl-phospholipid synthase-like methyltransferase
LDFHEVQDRFLTKLPLGARILDFGCGAGRDAKYFAEKGFEVVATDGSEELCNIANQFTGVVAKRMFFSELDETESYDGIWACASILHLRKEEIMDVIPRMIRAVKTDGYLYMSFKYGTFEGYRGERYFTNFTEKSFEEFIEPFSNVTIMEKWISSDVRPGRGEEKWLNLILQKRTIN